MKNFLLTISLVSFFGFTSIAQSYQGDSWSKVRASGSGTLACVYYPTPGLVYEENGQVKGVCVDIINDFKKFVKDKYGKTINVKFVGKETVWTNFLTKTLNGSNVLGVANVTITPERKKKMKFSPPFMTNPLIFLTHSSAPSISSPDQIAEKLAGYTPLVIKGSTHVPVMKQLQSSYFPGQQIKYTNSGIETLQQIQANKKTFSILDFTEYFDAVRNKMPLKRQNIDIEGPQEELGFIMPMNSDWQPLWEEFLSPAYKQSVTYKKIVANNLGNAFLGMLK
ncbi:transporter substrate-binding domain-containing protein [Fulvivirga sp. RKSG066]|uniref:substrate-binding periplasmic protein n=1 Tax=Fulvivirga aurantia TaxID=2529383 RepID=UPI0012BB9DAF|nr:transporter substrate-binding domain-containing protein [Fulvivirga aurantia]MTI20874.1 transporter substrate-binding domain-containing protein [Fulvivirga aurantia]